MRTFVKWAAVPTVVLVVAAVMMLSARDKAPELSADLAGDLDLVAASNLELAPIGAGASVVSDAEQIERPAPRRTPTPSRNRGTKAPPPLVVAVSDVGEEGADIAETAVPAVASEEPTLMIPTPDPTAPPAVPRPRPVEPRFPVGMGGTGDAGSGGGIGTIVIRGGRTGGRIGVDDCAIHDRRGAGPAIHIAINQRMPGAPTFPGSSPTFPHR